jgi:hypothetical protein
MSAQQNPPPPAPYPYPQAAPPAPPKKSRTALYVVAVVVVVAVVAVGVLAASGAFSPKPAPSPTLTPDSTNLINTASETFGPGTTGAVVVGFDIPTVGGSWVNGSFAVTVCTSVGDYCLANAWLFTPSAWSNYEHGGTVTGTCLTQVIGTNCQSEQNVVIASGDLSSFAGQTLDLCLWSNATTEQQTFSADVNFNFFSTSG